MGHLCKAPDYAGPAGALGHGPPLPLAPRELRWRRRTPAAVSQAQAPAGPPKGHERFPAPRVRGRGLGAGGRWGGGGSAMETGPFLGKRAAGPPGPCAPFEELSGP